MGGEFILFLKCVKIALESPSQLRPKICCSFKNLAVNYVTLTALHSTVKILNEQQILGLTQLSSDFITKSDRILIKVSDRIFELVTFRLTEMRSGFNEE